MTGLEPWLAARSLSDPVAARLAEVRAGRSLDLLRLPADAPLALSRLIADCTALDRAKRPRMGRVRAVMEQAYDEHLGGRFDVVSRASAFHVPLAPPRCTAPHVSRPHYSPLHSTEPRTQFLSHCWGRDNARKPLTDAIYFALKESGLRVWCVPEAGPRPRAPHARTNHDLLRLRRGNPHRRPLPAPARERLDSNEMGLDLVTSMANGIAKSDCVLALLSPDYERSRQCMFELRFASGVGVTEGDAEAQRDALAGRLASAQANADAAQAHAARAEEAAARQLADATAKVEGRTRSVAAAQQLADMDVLELSIGLLRAAKAGEEHARAEGLLAVDAARAAAAAAAETVCAACADAEHETASRAALKSNAMASAAPASAPAVSSTRRPVVACIVEPNMNKLEGWSPSEELKQLAGLTKSLYADASGAARVDWSAELVPEADRRTLTHDAKALPRVLELVAAARKKAASGVGAGGGAACARAVGNGSSGTPPASNSSPLVSHASPQASSSSPSATC